MEKHYVKYLVIVMLFLFTFVVFESFFVYPIANGILLSPAEGTGWFFGLIAILSPLLIGLLIVFVLGLLLLIIYDHEELVLY